MCLCVSGHVYTLVSVMETPIILIGIYNIDSYHLDVEEYNAQFLNKEIRIWICPAKWDMAEEVSKSIY